MSVKLQQLVLCSVCVFHGQKPNSRTSVLHGHPSNITVDGNTVEQVDNFIHLDSTQSSNGGSQADIMRRIALASSVMSSLQQVWKDRYLSLPTKVRVYEMLVLPVLRYACETWTVLVADERCLEAFHMK